MKDLIQDKLVSITYNKLRKNVEKQHNQCMIHKNNKHQVRIKEI
jgi:hypothetical protein